MKKKAGNKPDGVVARPIGREQRALSPEGQAETRQNVRDRNQMLEERQGAVTRAGDGSSRRAIEEAFLAERKRRKK